MEAFEGSACRLYPGPWLTDSWKNVGFHLIEHWMVWGAFGFLAQRQAKGVRSERALHWRVSPRETEMGRGCQACGVKCEGRRATELGYSVHPDCWTLLTC